MRLPTALLGLSAAFIAGVAAIGDCDSGPFAPVQPVGDKHDSSKHDVEICETQYKQGNVVTGIEVWANKKRITGINLKYASGDESHMIGSKDGDDHQKIDWEAKTDKVTRAVLWSDWDAKQLGGLRIELDNDEYLEVKQEKVSGVKFEVEVGSGILLGAMGRADDHITAWGWLFLEDEVKKITVGDFKWDEDQDEYVKKEKGIETVVYNHMEHLGTQSNSSTISMSPKKTETEGYSYSMATSWKFGLGYELEISGKVFGIGGTSKYKLNAEVGQEFKKEWSQSESVDLSFNLAQATRSGYTTMCIGFYQFGKFDMGYESTVRLELKNGRKFEFRERGVRKLTKFGGSQTACADEEGDHRGDNPTEFIERNTKKTLAQLAEKKEKDEAEKKKNESRGIPTIFTA